MGSPNSYNIKIGDNVYSFENRYVRAETLIKRARRLTDDLSRMKLQEGPGDERFGHDEMIDLKEHDTLELFIEY